MESSGIHEVDFCSQIASAVNILVSQNAAAYPFLEARVEGFGSGAAQRKRKDLRFFDRDGKVVLCGEVKLPGTLEGRSAFDGTLIQDAFAKADNAGVQFFFTWTVNEFVLFDRSRWELPLIERCVGVRRLPRTLASAEEVARPSSLEFIKAHFLPDLLRDLAEILSGRRRGLLAPDDVFIRSLESHLDWPVQLLSNHILEHAGREKPFAARVERWMSDQERTFVRSPHEEWVKAVEAMAKTLAYIWANRLIFYKALRTRFPDLPRLDLRASITKPDDAVAVFNRLFQKGVERSGDYEPLLMPSVKDWATSLVFHPKNALDAWRGLLRGIESVDFRQVPSDVVGRIFQKLISPDERHRYGQHFTGDDVVDLINAFCIRNASDAVLDPACGSGSFLVRAYYRKRNLDAARSHLDLIGELFGCDIAAYPAHLATLNLAAREINDEANYPRIARRNFFDFAPSSPFCQIPDNKGGELTVPLPALDAVVGNPPYVRQEKIEAKEKARIGRLAASAWPGLSLSGRTDLHCYFWPAAARLLKPDGYFGFLTSSSWLDVEYGFALQGWLLRRFRILAIMESAAEPWFEDARVKTCATILQGCDDERERMDNPVRFVRFNRKLSEIIGVPPTPEDEGERQKALERLRSRILKAALDCHDEDMRIISKTQRELWNDGVRAGAILREQDESLAAEYENGEEEADRVQDDFPGYAAAPKSNGEYRAGKWGRYLRAPDFYFEIMRRFGSRFVPLGEIAAIRRGITSGCDAFFMPKDITADKLHAHKDDRAFRQNAGGAPRKAVESGKLKIIQDGNGVVHPVEAGYLAPEVHSLMKIDRPVVRAADLDRVVLLVGEPMHTLKAKAPWVWRYLRYGTTAEFRSGKTKAVSVPKRSTCAARDPWYDLTALVNPGFAFWPKGQQYRHIVIMNPNNFVCNCRLYDMYPAYEGDKTVLAAMLNSTLVALWRNFYGRYTGTEGALETMVVDVLMIDVPDARVARPAIAKRMVKSFDLMCKRVIGDLIEEQLMDCHTPERARRIAAGPLALSRELQQPDRRELDDAVLELLGVADPKERETLLARLYEAAARHFREIRVVEIEKMEQRSKSDNRRFSVHDLAADIWDAAQLEDAAPLAEWVSRQPQSDALVSIPEERPVRLSDDALFAPNSVYFGRERKSFVDCPSRGQAELVARLAQLGICGEVKLPAQHDPCFKLLDRLNVRLEKTLARFKELIESRTSDERIRAQLLEALERWFVIGREGPKSTAPPGSEPEAGEP